MTQDAHTEDGLDQDLCRTCGGYGEVEVIEYQRDDSTGHNTVEHPTGRFKPCPDCGGPRED